MNKSERFFSRKRIKEGRIITSPTLEMAKNEVYCLQMQSKVKYEESIEVRRQLKTDRLREDSFLATKKGKYWKHPCVKIMFLQSKLF